MKHNRFLNTIILVLATAISLVGEAAAEDRRLFVYAGAGLRPALEKVAALFEQRTGVKVLLDYGVADRTVLLRDGRLVCVAGNVQ